MQNLHGSPHPDARQQQQEQGSDARAGREFKPVRLPAVAAAVQANKPALAERTLPRLPAFLRDDHQSD